jgi:hypothetical protein
MFNGEFLRRYLGGILQLLTKTVSLVNQKNNSFINFFLPLSAKQKITIPYRDY